MVPGSIVHDRSGVPVGPEWGRPARWQRRRRQGGSPAKRDGERDGSGYDMWIGLLGPLEVRNATGAVRVTAPKHKSLLAALAVHAGNVVSKESLADAVWDGDWPAKWPVTLRNYIKDIKKVLPPDSDRIEWR